MTLLVLLLSITCFILAYFAYKNKPVEITKVPVQKVKKSPIVTPQLDISDKIILKNISYIKMMQNTHNLKQKDLAEYGNTSPTTMSRILNNHPKVPKKTILKITDQIIDKL